MVVAASKARLSGRLHGHGNAGLYKACAQKAVSKMPQSYSSSSSQSLAQSARRKRVFSCSARTSGTSHPSVNKQLEGFHTDKAFIKAGLALSSKTRHGTHIATGSFMGLMGQILKDMAPAVPSGCDLMVENVCYHPAGSPTALLTDLSLQLPANQLGLIYGRSGAGKTTLLQLLAGLTDTTSGQISLGSGTTIGTPASAEPVQMNAMTPQELAKRCGLVFQFPERYFLGGTLQEEIVFGWPFDEYERQAYSVQAHRVLEAVGLKHIPVQTPLQQLSGGYKRRVALAVQLVRRPAVLLLDEPLAGLDWRARIEVADTLKQLKSECTILVVSHDLRELTPLVNKAWQMQPGGRLQASPWPPQELQ